ncbi:MAG TPA: sigma-70 family RNA polymerase sigma factor [Terriglobales bacterium]|nr:sigma-70 family RNA polymerase sigma factor [Terriglobales bacterium]
MAAQPQPGSDEQALINRVRAGDSNAFYDLVRPHERAIYVTAYSILQEPSEAEDVAQETVLKAFRSLHQFRGDARFGTWLITIAMNEARMRLRSRQRARFESLDATAPDDPDYVPLQLRDWREIPSQALERQELRVALARSLAALDEKYREVLVLRDVQLLNVAETAEVLGITPGNVKVRLLRARLQMRDRLVTELSGWHLKRKEK